MPSHQRNDLPSHDRHFLNGDGMVACKPRDSEAARRAKLEGNASENLEQVTCRKCIAAAAWEDGDTRIEV